MELVEKVKLEFDGNEAEVEAVIDTGAEITMFDEETLLKLGSPNLTKRLIEFGGEKREAKPLYFLGSLKIQNCIIPVVNVIGGKKNLIGHDILQRARARIDEGRGTIEFPERDGIIQM